MREMRVLVTGGGGFIGSHLVEQLLERGDAVRVLDNFATGNRENLSSVLDEIDLVEGDIRLAEHARAATHRCDLVIHEAALSSVSRSIDQPVATTQVNVVGTLNVLMAARDAGVRRVVLGSSSSVYGTNPALPKTEDLSPEPVSPYAVSKLAAEHYCRSFTELYGLETVVLRYFNVFGPRQNPFSEYAAAVPRFITACLTGEHPLVFGDGEQSRDFTYVDNVVAGTILAMEAPAALDRVFNIATGGRITVNALIETVAQVTGRTIDPVFQEARPGEVRHSTASIDRARRILNFEPRIDFTEGLARTVAFYLRRTVRPLEAGDERARVTEAGSAGRLRQGSSVTELPR
jgi:nucleoside-diphosphate-sugar epimerase